MSATAPRTCAYPLCPDWCTEHVWPDRDETGFDLHRATDRTGLAGDDGDEWMVGIGFSANDGQGHDHPIDCAAVESLSPLQARRLARALLDAAAEVEASWAVERARAELL